MAYFGTVNLTAIRQLGLDFGSDEITKDGFVAVFFLTKVRP